MAKPKLLECHFLIPIQRDSEISDGEPHEPATWQWLENELMDRFDGWRAETAPHRGAWRSSKTGRISCDVCRCYLVAVVKNELKELRRFLQLACGTFAQQCIYLSVAGIVEFVETEK